VVVALGHVVALGTCGGGIGHKKKKCLNHLVRLNQAAVLRYVRSVGYYKQYVPHNCGTVDINDPLRCMSQYLAVPVTCLPVGVTSHHLAVSVVTDVMNIPCLFILSPFTRCNIYTLTLTLTHTDDVLFEP